MAVRGLSGEKREEFDRELSAPLPHSEAKRKKPTHFEAEDEAASFVALYAQVKGGAA